MPRISHNTPLAAYDHINKLLKDAAGPDGVVSRDDADKLVAQLKADGRGTEALAAQNLFKMIDARDNNAGARVTGYDLDQTRAFVEQKMLENRDVNHNGYSQAEIEKMSPTGRALVELGETLQVEAKAGRVAHRTPREGLHHVAGLILDAAGADGITSRADIEKLGDKLYKAGRGTEQLALKTFFAFIDHRDAGSGNRVTKADVEKAVTYAEGKLLENKDQNRNGYSQAEIKSFSKSAKAFLLLGQMIDAGILDSAAVPLSGAKAPAAAKPADGATGKDIQAELGKHIDGLELDDFGSEGGVGFETVHIPGRFTALTEDSFKEGFNMQADTPDNVVERFSDLPAMFWDEFVDMHERYYPAPAGENAAKLAEVMKGLEDVKVVITGEDGTTDAVHPAFIVGRAPDNSLVGIQSGVVWT